MEASPTNTSESANSGNTSAAQPVQLDIFSQAEPKRLLERLRLSTLQSTEILDDTEIPAYRDRMFAVVELECVKAEVSEKPKRKDTEGPFDQISVMHKLRRFRRLNADEAKELFFDTKNK